MARQLIVNDAFGALTVPQAREQIINWGDSALSALAISENLMRNQMPQVSFATSHDPLPTTDRVLIKIPDSARLLQWQLAKLNQALPSATPVIIAGMQKHIGKAHEQAIERYLADVTPQLIKQRARLWLGRTSSATEMPTCEHFQLSDMRIHQHPGVFAEQRLDLGTRVLLDYLDEIAPAATVCDLCCGAGPIAAAWLAKYPEAQMTLTDASAIAISCGAQTMSDNFADADITLHHTDGLTHIDQSFDLILCNPPFHQHGAITTDLAWHLFKQAAKALNPGGRFVVVANRHLGYHQILKRLFKKVTTISRDPKFVVLVAS